MSLPSETFGGHHNAFLWVYDPATDRVVQLQGTAAGTLHTIDERLTFNGVYAKVVAVQEEGVVFNETLVGATDQTPIGNSLDALKVTAPDLIISIDSDASHNPQYLGLSVRGTATSAALWQIRKFTIDANNNVSAIRYANASAAFNAVWDDRASLSYS